MDNLSLEKQPIRILFLGSDPTDQGKVRLGKELEVIRAELSKNTSFEIKDRQAVKPKDALTTIMNYKPNIVHFSGHGMESGEICFEDERGLTKAVPPDVLADLFKLTTDYVKCVVLNTCFSDKQVKAISPFVPMVIGTMHEISDTAAINFSAGFYTALEPDLSQKSLVRAFESGRINIKLEDVPEHLSPVMIEGTPEVRFSSEIDSAFRSITKNKGVVFDVLRKGLELTGKKMGLDSAMVTQILSDKVSQLEKHLDALAEYETALKGFLEDEYPLSEAATTALAYLQNGLEL